MVRDAAFGPTLLATAALGYAGGIPRALSNRGFGFIAGRRAAFAGRVSMDTTTLDVTDLAALKTGDLVEFLGDHMLLEEVAALAGTNAYEFLTGLKVPRHYSEAA